MAGSGMCAAFAAAMAWVHVGCGSDDAGDPATPASCGAGGPVCAETERCVEELGACTALPEPLC